MNSKTELKNVFCIAALALIFLSVVFVSSADAASMLEQVYEKFNSHKDIWLQRMGVLLWWSFVTLLTLSFSWQTSQLAVSGNFSLGAALWIMVQIIFYGGFFNWLFNNTSVLNLIPDTFIWLAEQTTGYSADVFGMLDVGLNLAKNMWEQSTQLAWYETAFGAICILAVEILFFMIVGQMIMAKIETIMITLSGFVLLVFAGLMHSLGEYAKTYLRALVACGFKLFVLAIVCSIIQEFSGDLVLYMGASNGFWTGAGMILGIMVVMWIIVRNIPSFIATSLMGGAPGASLSNAMITGHTMMAVTSALVGVSSAIREMGAKISNIGSTSDTRHFNPDSRSVNPDKMTMVGIDDGR